MKGHDHIGDTPIFHEKTMIVGGSVGSECVKPHIILTRTTMERWGPLPTQVVGGEITSGKPMYKKAGHGYRGYQCHSIYNETRGPS